MDLLAIVVGAILLHGKQLIVDWHHKEECEGEAQKGQCSRVDESVVFGSVVAHSIGYCAHKDTELGDLGCLAIHLVKDGQWILASLDCGNTDIIHAEADTSEYAIGKETDRARSVNQGG